MFCASGGACVVTLSYLIITYPQTMTQIRVPVFWVLNLDSRRAVERFPKPRAILPPTGIMVSLHNIYVCLYFFQPFFMYNLMLFILSRVKHNLSLTLLTKY